MIAIAHRAVTCIDWRDEAPAVIAPLLARECRTWDSQLGWDLAADWAVLEPARQARWLPGWTARDSRTGDVRGWTFAVDRQAGGSRERQIGALVADTEDTAGALIETLLASPCPQTVTVFHRVTAACSTGAWRARGFQVQAYDYLVARVDALGTPPARVSWRPWTDGAIPGTTELLRRSYAGQPDLRPFAPEGSPAEWREYVEGLIGRPGCGALLPGASLVVGEGAAVDAVAVTTRIGPGTAHLAQLAVAPHARRAGTARALVLGVGAAIRQTGAGQSLTLLVSAANAPARRLYHGLGFRPRGAFLAARRTPLPAFVHQDRA